MQLTPHVPKILSSLSCHRSYYDERDKTFACNLHDPVVAYLRERRGTCPPPPNGSSSFHGLSLMTKICRRNMTMFADDMNRRIATETTNQPTDRLINRPAEQPTDRPTGRPATVHVYVALYFGVRKRPTMCMPCGAVRCGTIQFGSLVRTGSFRARTE